MLSQEILERNQRIQNVVQPISTVLARMSYFGIPISKSVLFSKADFWRNRINRCKEELFNLLGSPQNQYRFNVDSPGQLQEVLYEKLKLHKKHEKGKLTADATALAKLHFEYKDTEYDHIIHLIREIKLLRHRASNFLWPFLDWEDCPKCKAKTKGDCDECAGTGVGKILGHNPRLVTVDKNGYWWTHYTLLQVPNTLRLSCVSLNFQQFARYQANFNIRVRDIVVAPLGYLMCAVDKTKGEAFGCAIIFQAGSIIKTLKDKEAFSVLASKLFNVPVSLCAKGTPYYIGGKTVFYAAFYGAQAETIQKVLVKMAGIYLTVDQVKQALIVFRKLYDDYFTNVKEYTWESYKRGWCRSVQGAIFRIPRDPVLEQFEHWTQIYRHPDKDFRREAIVAFEKACRAVSSFVVQSTVTGLAAQLDLLKLVDEMDKRLNPTWSVHRVKNGDWGSWRPILTKHDEIITLFREELKDIAVEAQERVMKDWNNFEPYLENHSSIKIPLGVETKIFRQWDEEPPENWRELTKEKNPLDFYDEHGIHFVE